VLIESKAAWRAEGDYHVCTLQDGSLPHVGGAVAVGSVTVRIAGLPAARQGDLVQEALSANAIVSGARTVLIG